MRVKGEVTIRVRARARVRVIGEGEGEGLSDGKAAGKADGVGRMMEDCWSR